MAFNLNLLAEASPKKAQQPARKTFKPAHSTKQKKLPLAKKRWFFGELEILIQSGIDIKSAFDFLCHESRDKRILAMTQDISKLLVQGQSLSGALAKMSVFSPLDVGVVAAGEETGKLAFALTFLRSYYQKRIDRRRATISTLTYPMVVFAFAIMAVSFLVGFVVPMFRNIYARFHQELPWITQKVIALSDNFPRIATISILTALAITWLLLYLWHSFKFRLKLYLLLLKIPGIGSFIRTFFLERFFRIFSLLTHSGVPVMQATTTLKGAINFAPLEVFIDQLQKDLINGGQLYQSMQKNDLFSYRINSMVKMGEEVNKLGVIMDQLAEQLGNDLDLRSKTLSTVAEPILILLIGAVVGVILVAMYLPIFRFGSFSM